MAKKLIVPIIADSSAFKRGLKESEKAAQEFEQKIKGTASNVKHHILGMGAALVGVGGLVEGLKVSVQAAEALNVSTRSLNAQLRANGESVKAIHPQVEKLNAQMANLGFTSSEAEQAFTRLDRASGSAAAAAKYMGLTADFARAKHIELSQAALIVGKVMDGNTTAFNRYGIAIPKGTSATDALRIAQQKLAGQAAANVTPQEKFHAILTNIEAVIGQQLLPTVDKYLNKLSDWFSKSENQKKITDAVKQAVVYLREAIDVLKTALGYIKTAFEKFSDAVGGSKHAIELLVAAFAAFKTAELLGSIATVATKVGLIGGAASTATAEVGTFRAALIGLGSASVLGPLALAAAGIAALIYASREQGSTTIQGRTTSGQNIGKTGSGQYVIMTPRGPLPISAAEAASLGVTGALTRGPGGAHGGGGTYGASSINALLRSQGATPAEAAYLTYASTHHEDPSGNPSALNDNPHTHDYSVGLFQINFRDMHNKWMRGGAPAAAKLAQDPAAQARYALSLLHSQGPGAWPTSAGMASSFGLGGGGGGGGGTLPGDAIAAAAAEKKAAAAAKAAASAAYKAWKENYFTPLDNQYKADMLVTNESKRLNALEALHAKLAIDLKNTTGKEHQAILNEEDKVQSKILSIKQKQHNAAVALIAKEKAAYIAGLQAQQAALTKQMSKAQAELQRNQTVFDRAWTLIADKVTNAFNAATADGLAAINAKYGAATPEEQAAAAFQAQLDAAQRAADFAAAQDPVALKAVTDKYHLQDLQDAAAKSRAIANQTAAEETQTFNEARKAQLQNIQDWLADQKTALESGSLTWDQFWAGAFSDAPAKYAPDAVSSLQGVIDQMRKIRGIQSDIDANSAAMANVKGTGNKFGSLDPAIATAMIAHGKAIPMKMGGSGVVTQPTLFLAGEGGRREEYAFSGAGKSFDSGAGGGSGPNITLQVGPVYGAIDQATARQWAATLKTELDRVIQYR